MSLKSLLTADNKKYILGLFFAGWLVISFYTIYFLTTSGVSGWRFFTTAFINYLVYFCSISTVILIYILTNGKISEIKKHARLLIVVSSILLVFSFSFIRWTTLTTSYGQYGNYGKMMPEAGSLFFFNYGADSAFEKETVYREAVALKYDNAFKQIWTFSGFVFVSVFLLLMALGKRDNMNE